MAELQRGTPLLIQQYKALLKKNYLLSWRSKRSFFLQLFSSFFFILLMFCIDKFITFRSHSSNGDVLDPKPLVHPPIPPCEMKFAIRYPCYDFVWSGNNSPRVRSIVGNIMKNNPGRPIPPDKVKSFGTQDEVDTWLFSHPLRCPGALHFVERNATVISYGVQTNSTEVIFHNKNEDPTFKFQIPLQIAAEREITRHLLGDHGFSWTVGFKEFAHPDLSESSHTGSSSDDVVGTLGPTFFFAISMFGFMFQIGSLVGEKELKLRQAMSMMGLYDTSYWLSWLTWEALISAVSSLFTVLFGTMFRLNLFRHNNFVILFLLFFLFQLNMIGFAFMISTFITKASSTSTVGFSILVIGFLTQPFSSILYDQGVRKLYWVLWSLFPPNLLAEALSIFGDKNAHISWTTWTKCTDDVDCVITIAGIYTWLISTFLVWFLLAMYFDNIFPNSEGVRKSLFYFLKPGYWTGKGGNRVEGGICSCTSSVPVLEEAIVHDEDVREEEHVVKQQVTEGVDSNVAVQIRGLVKTYPRTRKLVCCCCCCCKCKTTSPYHAIKGLWVNFAKDQLFCLLGPNGAGKTTTINCLTGITPVTNGDALIYGYSIRSSVGMSHIRRMIGVCPQFDLLWDALSGEEHLELFANIKGMPPSSIKSLVKKSLEEVRLTYAAKMRAGSYSGGMKRRVSFAIALIGDPKLVILDEPTTGMDPITRRHVWNMIEEAKKGRAIVLTTHSMEEADILADRIGIMAKGKLRCIGTSIRLKSRFGAGFVVTVSFHGSATGQIPDGEGNEGATSDLHREEVKHFFREWLNVVPKEETNAFLTFVISHEKEELLTCFLEELVSRDREFGISDIQLGLTTLEDVFLNIANKAELESAITEGAFATLKLESGASLQIPKGARFIGIPGTESDENPTGLMVEVYWEQDEGGVYSITGHSPETPIPLNARPVAFPALNQNANLGRTRHVLGLVIDPNDIEGRNN